MADLESLLSDLANLDAKHDLDGLRRVREQIIAEHPDSDAAVEASYKVGLDFLFRERDLPSAIIHFDSAAKRRHPFWSAAARTSLGLCYYHQGRVQKALFELRKVAYPESPTSHSVTALAFIENIAESQGGPEEARRIRKDRIKQLEDLVELHRDSGQAAERGFYLYSLGLALKDQGDRDGAKRILEEAQTLGPDVLGADLFRSVVSALS
ncbi:MAG: tetratricopeptide repeat protein [Myxococcota bacterium]